VHKAAAVLASWSPTPPSVVVFGGGGYYSGLRYEATSFTIWSKGKRVVASPGSHAALEVGGLCCT
jgi:hypothetical protein